jgi:ribosome-binding factor A
MVDFRLEKFNKTVKKIIGESISTLEDYSDFSMISIMRVETSKDFSYSKVFVSIFDELSENESEEIVTKLNEKAFYFQKIISRKIRTSRIPKVKFYLDKSSEFQRQIDELIDEVYFEK